MTRLLALFILGLFASVAVADIPPPPPPKGKKYVNVNNEVKLGKDVTGYVFVQQFGAGIGRPTFTYQKLDLSTDKATAMPEGGRRTYLTLIAVPQDVAKGFKTDAELLDALKANKVKGIQRMGFAGTTTVSDKVEGNSVKWTHTITAVDAKGIKTTVEGEGAAQKGDRPGKKEQAPLQANTLIAGIAAFVGIMLSGLWLAGRARRKA